MALSSQAYYADPKKMRKMAASSLMLVAGAVWIGVWPPYALPVILRVIELFCGLFFVPTFAYFTSRAIFRTPSVTLDEIGLRDTSSLAPGGLVRWNDIATVAVYSVQKHKFVGVELKDNDAFLRRAGSFRRFIGKRSLAKCKYMVAIPEGTISVTPEELVEQIDHFKRTYAPIRPAIDTSPIAAGH